VNALGNTDYRYLASNTRRGINMSLREEIEKYWKKIDDGFDKIVESGILPVGKEADGTLMTKESLRAELDGLQRGVYTIAVCGSVKAGKSTLLNSLIFGDSILPAIDTPMTAKLTFIRHAKGKPKFSVEFYDKVEWEQIRNTCSDAEREQLNQRVQKCAEAGISPNMYICSPRRDPIVGHNLKEELPCFISDPFSGAGKYTPYVKSVTITVDHPELEGLQIVDTPGLNDSNEINSRETARWVREAHAVVYVLETRGASQPDVEFFQSYFPSTSTEARVFVQNKIDTEPDYESAKSAIRKYGQEEKYKQLGLFGVHETICSYSSLAVLIQRKLKAGFELTEDEVFQLENNIPPDYRGDPDNLEVKLAEKLFSKEGTVRINKACGLLMAVYQLAIAKNEADIAALERQIPDCDKSANEIAKEIDKYEKYEKKIRQASEDKRENFDNYLQERLGKLKDSLDNVADQILDKVRSAAASCGGSDTSIRARVPIALNRAKRLEFQDVRNVAFKIKGELRKKLLDIRDEFNDDAVEAGIMDKVVISSVAIDVRDKVQVAIDGIVVNGDALYDMVPGRIKRFFSGATVDDVTDMVVGAIEPAVRENVDNCFSTLEDTFTQAFDKEFSGVIRGFVEHCDQRRGELENAKKGLEKAKARKVSLERNLKKAKAQRVDLDDSERAMKHILGVAV